MVACPRYRFSGCPLGGGGKSSKGSLALNKALLRGSCYILVLVITAKQDKNYHIYNMIIYNFFKEGTERSLESRGFRLEYF
jgi:hypothetical protein